MILSKLVLSVNGLMKRNDLLTSQLGQLKKYMLNSQY